MGQVVTFHADGGVSGLQTKPGKGLDLRSLGPAASIVRASEIVFSVEAQRWTVQIQDAPGLEAIKGVVLTPRMAEKAGLSAWVGEALIDGTAEITGEDEPLLFDSYDDAVAFEIAFLDAWRLRGVF